MNTLRYSAREYFTPDITTSNDTTIIQISQLCRLKEYKARFSINAWLI